MQQEKFYIRGIVGSEDVIRIFGEISRLIDMDVSVTLTRKDKRELKAFNQGRITEHSSRYLKYRYLSITSPNAEGLQEVYERIACYLTNDNHKLE